MGKTEKCVSGCPPGEVLYSFPINEERRKIWLNFFGVEEDATNFYYACARHFSLQQKIGGKLCSNGVPDLHLNPGLPKLQQKTIVITPSIKSVACSVAIQTNTRLCAAIQLTSILDEYLIDCFYCCDTFQLENWREFVDHLKDKHIAVEPVSKIKKQPYCDHDYTELRSPPFTTKIRQVNSSLLESLEKIEEKSLDTPLDIKKAEKLIQLLDETVLNPNYKSLEEDPLAIKDNNDTKSINVSEEIVNDKKLSSPQSSKMEPVKNKTILTIRSTPTRIKTFNKISTIENESIPDATTDEFVPSSSVEYEATLKQFENGNSFKEKDTRSQISSGIFYIKDTGNNTITKEQPSLNKCSDRSKNSEKNEPGFETPNLNPAELVFQFTPKSVIMDLLENMKEYPNLWKFHKQANETYSKSIQELCTKINSKWSLNVTVLQMRRSINRILSYYRYMLPCEKVATFEEYFKKCSEFLPQCEDDIPYKRCEYCDICYSTDVGMLKHLEEQHEYLKWPNRCVHCSDRFMGKDEYELHRSLPHYMEIFRCKSCSKRFNSRGELKKHLKTHETGLSRFNNWRAKAYNPIPALPLAKMHKCEICDMAFKTTSEMKSHKVFHGEKFYKCDQCPKSYFRKVDLNRHLKRHSNQLDFVCEICGKAFLLKRSLDDHTDIHTDRKVTCRICNLKLRRSSLPRHLRVCHVALEGTIEETFRAKYYHFKPHRKPLSCKKFVGPRKYVCKKCKISFESLKLFIDHNKEIHYTAKSKIHCKICNVCMNLCSLRKHYRNIHTLALAEIDKLLNEHRFDKRLLRGDISQTTENKCDELSDKDQEVDQNNDIEDELMKQYHDDVDDISDDNDDGNIFTDL